MQQMKYILLIVGLLIPGFASAHTLGGGGFNAGLAHPVLGVDHLLAMLSVGILSLQMGGRAIWMIPLMFIIVMMIGGVLGLQGVHLMSVEQGIALSVLILGLAIMIEKRWPLVLIMIAVAFFAIFHGHAHGTEMPNLAQPVLYVCGFILGTACIHILGVLLGYVVKFFKHGRQALRYLGAAMAGIGFYLCVGTVF